ncbi:DoxX family protein [Haloarchaeobius salinus]|uniref:DoxX family protein n=1 Tax=Haloarchaeobius salinus TaxID=1198298 RepID=UPI00210A27B6|nr:DoxX family protein [Haloarchaeobius salinus]
MTLEITGTAAVVFLVGRVLVGGVVAFMGLNHFMNAEDMAGYAGMKGVPAPGLMVPFTGGMLLFGGLSIALGFYPAIGAGAIAVFLVVTTPLMHDFWAMDDPEQQQNEMTAFLKNVVMLGAALAFLVLAGTGWEYSIATGELAAAAVAPLF